MGNRRLRKYKEWEDTYTKVVERAIEKGSFTMDLWGPEQAARSRYDCYQFIRTLKEADDVPEHLRLHAHKLRIFWKRGETWMKVVIDGGEKDIFKMAASLALSDKAEPDHLKQRAEIVAEELEDDDWDTSPRTKKAKGMDF